MSLQKLSLWLLVALVVLVTACTEQKSVKEQIDEAQSLISQKNYPHAIIALKNVIKLAPNNAEARFMLSQLYFDEGQTEGAEKELNKAIKHGLDVEKYSLFLAELYIEMNDSAKALEILSSFSTEHETENILANILKGRALLSLGDVGLATEAFGQANDIKDDAAYSLYGSAIVASIGSEYEKAAKLLEQSIGVNADIAEVWLLRARIAEARKNYQLSISAYQKFLDLRPNAHSIKLLIVENYIKLGQLEQAEKIVDDLLAINENHPTSNLLKARIAGQRDNFSDVKLYSEVALNSLSANPLALYLSGIANYYLDNFELSYARLSQVAEQLPKGHQAHKLLMINMIKLGYFDQLDKAISNYGKFETGDIAMLDSIGEHLVSQGELDGAAKAYEQLADLKTNANEEKTKLAVLKLLHKDLQGISELEEITSGEVTNRNAVFALAVTHYKNEEFLKAQQSLAMWLKENPTDVEALLFKAKIFEAQSNLSQSKTVLEQAKEIASDNTDVLYMLARNAFKAGRYEQAKQSLSTLITKEPNYKKAYTLLFLLAKEKGEESQFFDLLTAKIINDEGLYLWPRLMLAQNDLANNRVVNAESILNDITVSQLPSAYYSTLIDLYAKKGEMKKVDDVSTEWQKRFPNQVVAHIKQIALVESNGAVDRALELTQSALSERRFSDNLQLNILRADFLIRLNRVDEATSVVEKLESLDSHHHVVKLLLGQYQLAKGNLAKAKAQFQLSYEQQPSEKALLLLTDVLRKSHKTNEAIAVINQANIDIQSQVTVQTILAEMYVQTEPNKTIEIYKSLVEKAPRNVLLLNNLSWMLVQEKEFAAAVMYARKAEKIMPNYGAILDTLGVALLGNNEDKAALEVLSKARENSNEVSIKVHLAIALHRNDDEDAAKELLARLSSSEKEKYKAELIASGLL